MPQTNRLAAEKSPYLLQHAANPVHWRPWGEEAWAAAREQDRPVFLSIGYSTCHWCHVMAHESFEHPAAAELLNAAFVCVKVDREERPDLDAVYMAACQMLTGRGGWPLTLFLTPQGKPFFAGTYLPRESRFGQLGLMELTRQIGRAWAEDRDRVLAAADRVAGAMAQAFAPAPPAEVSDQAFGRALDHFKENFDAAHGGFGGAPKFPSPHQILFLLRAWQKTGDASARRMATHTLRRMRQGGIFDQAGLGFHRYSTDERWLAPHFEKMLYDQGMLLAAYAQTFQATADPFFARVCREVAQYLRRDLRGPEGAFLSAEDADSEGEEGRFYVWTLDELEAVLGPGEARFWAGRMGLAREGNFRDEASGRDTGTNILHFPEALPPELEERWEAARLKLLAARSGRVRPHRDDKVLADWNGLAAAGLALAGRALDDPEMVADAGRAVDFVLRAMRRPDGRLLHRWREGEAAVDGLAEDYAFLAWGLLELHAATLDENRLAQARQLVDILLADFWDDAAGGLFLSPAHGENLLLRPKEAFDAALPSANSVALLLLPRLFRLTGESLYMDKAQAIARAFGAQVEAAPFGHALFLCALDLARNPGLDVRLTGDPAAEPARSLRRELDRRYLPDLTLGLAPPPEGLATPGVEKRPAALLCRAGTCFASVNSPEELRRVLDQD
jgi:uncharacterized protein YyaL (SSP411 family)